MNLLRSECLFIFLGTLVGFGSLLLALVNCYIVNPIGLWSIKLIMGPFLLVYLFNGVTLAFILSHMFISYLPEATSIDAYIHNTVKFILSAITSVLCAKMWNSFRYSALCIRFSECDEDENFVITWTNNLTDILCGPPDANYINDECRRWVAQVPLMALSVISGVVVYKMGQLWDQQHSGTGTVAASPEPLAKPNPPPPPSIPITPPKNDCETGNKTSTSSEACCKCQKKCGQKKSGNCGGTCKKCGCKRKCECNSNCKPKRKSGNCCCCCCCPTNCACDCSNSSGNSQFNSSIVNLGDVIRNSLR